MVTYLLFHFTFAHIINNHFHNWDQHISGARFSFFFYTATQNISHVHNNIILIILTYRACAQQNSSAILFNYTFTDSLNLQEN